jgi:hypothetical protein
MNQAKRVEVELVFENVPVSVPLIVYRSNRRRNRGLI